MRAMLDLVVLNLDVDEPVPDTLLSTMCAENIVSGLEELWLEAWKYSCLIRLWNL